MPDMLQIDTNSHIIKFATILLRAHDMVAIGFTIASFPIICCTFFLLTLHCSRDSLANAPEAGHAGWQ